VKLLAITDRRIMGPDPVARIVSLIQKLGPRLIVQLREKDLEARTLWSWVDAILPIAEAEGSQLLINGRVDLAACFAPRAGVHLPEDGLRVGDARSLLGPNVVVSAAAHTVEDAVARTHEGATFVTLSPIFATPSKPNVLGLEVLSRAVRTGAPIYALGGIDETNAQDVLQTGVAGIAAIRAAWSDAPQRLLTSER
jgi:thiamine-phosphate pyrophosphorylase